MFKKSDTWTDRGSVLYGTVHFRPGEGQSIDLLSGMVRCQGEFTG